jgi:hypothetical protein
MGALTTIFFGEGATLIGPSSIFVLEHWVLLNTTALWTPVAK